MNETVPTTWPPAVVVRKYTTCQLCRTARGKACTGRGDHLARWLAAYSNGQISRDDLRAVIIGLTVVTKWTVVPEGEERAA